MLNIDSAQTSGSVVTVDASGASALTSLFIATHSLNGIADISVVNSTAGTAALARLTVSADAGSIALICYSGTFTTAGLAVQDAARLSAASTLAGGLVLDTAGAAPLIFGTNNVENWRIASGGAVSVATGLGAITHITGPTDQNFTIAAGAAASAAGRRLVLNAGAGNGAGNAGGAFALTSGAGVNGVSGSNAGGWDYTPGVAGTATTGTGGTGGTCSVTGRAGGTATGAAGIGGVGSAISFACGAGGAASDVASGNGGAGGGYTVTTGAGGASTAATGGAPGSVLYTLGNAGTGGNVAGATFGVQLGTRTGTGAQGAFQVIASDATTVFSVTNANVVNVGGASGSVGFFGTTATTRAGTYSVAGVTGAAQRTLADASALGDVLTFLKALITDIGSTSGYGLVGQ